jgi:hypothetical protein
MDTDLEVIIKDSNIVLTPANIKAYLLMTLQGLEYLHINWILHRVPTTHFTFNMFCVLKSVSVLVYS